MSPNLDCSWMLKDILEPHTWLWSIRDDLDSVFGERKWWVALWDVLANVCCIHKSPLPWCYCRGRVAGYPGMGIGGSSGLCSQLPQYQKRRGCVFFCTSLSLINRKLWANPCAATWFGVQQGKNPVPACSRGGGARALLSSLRIIIFQLNFSPHLSMFLQLKQFLLPNFQHLEFGFSLLKKEKKKIKIHSLDETPMPLCLPTISSFNFVSLANARSLK